MNNPAANATIAIKKVIICLLLLIFIGCLVYSWTFFATDHAVLHRLNKLPQNTLAFVDPASRIQVSSKEQKKLSEKFLINYFVPWHNKLTPEKLQEIQFNITYQLKKFHEKPGVSPNTHPYNVTWIKSIENNVDLMHFPNVDQNAITLRDSNIRILPTTDPSFADLASISRGYPFDNLQVTFIPAGTPVHIIQTSKDKAWHLVQACSYSGWIHDHDVAYVSKEYEKKWQTGSYAVSTQDNIPIFDHKHRLITKTRVGVLYPVSKSDQNEFIILTPVDTATGYAVTKSVHVSKAFLTNFPLTLSSANIAAVANNFMGKPYGWGGIYGYRDCSSTTKDLFATFGIWLPRHAQDQAQYGKNYSLTGLSDKQKEKKISQYGVPFITLINIPEHIGLYIGSKRGHPIVFQNMWGLHIYKLFNNKDRIVVGKTVITPLSFGKNFINTSLNHLHAANSMTILAP
jgi:cell wall-associated NlpC family hydrolase